MEKPSKVLVILFVLLAVVAFGGPAVLAVSFLALLVKIVLEQPEQINTQFFYFAILLPLVALIALLWAEIVLVVRIRRWKRKLTEGDPWVQ